MVLRTVLLRDSGDRSGRPSGAGRAVLIIVQNLSVPLDRRVWLECRALERAGYTVSVICPRGPGEPFHEVLEGVSIHRYRPAPRAEGVLGYAAEFAYSWVRTAALSLRVRRGRGFEVVQACNPPDTYWALARLWKAQGVRFVYDQHDLNPELFESRFGAASAPMAKLLRKGLLWLERMTYRAADEVISPNESYRAVAMGRGRCDPARVTVVRSGPDTDAMRPGPPDAALRSGAAHLLVYLGIMGPQDGVDQTLEVLHELVHVRGRSDVHLALLGFGDCLEQLRSRAGELDLDAHVTFTGRVGAEPIARYLSTADVGLCPDLKTPLNDVSTMNKSMEYMAFALPAVAFDLSETRNTAADAAIYVESGDIAAFADAVESLLDDPERRREMGALGRARVVRHFDWRQQAPAYVEVFDRLTVRATAAPSSTVRLLGQDVAGPDGPALETERR